MTYTRYGLALNDEENLKLQAVKKHYKSGVKKIFMGMVNAMYGKIPPHVSDEASTSPSSEQPHSTEQANSPQTNAEPPDFKKQAIIEETE